MMISKIICKSILQQARQQQIQMIPPNIVIDKFTIRPPQMQKYTYFLTHWHSDHYQGITNNWDYGPIFTSIITRKLLLTKYPKLQSKVIPLKIEVWYSYNKQSQQINDITSNQSQVSDVIKIILFDSNHIGGSVMILLIFNDKTYLHTGDMRFNRKVAENNTMLFKPTIDMQFQPNILIDELFLDNTYCDPIFKFPSRSKALKMIVDIIQKHPKKRIFLCTDTIGKQEAFILLSQKYKTPIVLNEERYYYCLQMGIIKSRKSNQKPSINNFTLNPNDGWIQVIKKSEKQQKMKQYPMSVSILMTGWANVNQYQSIGYNYYVVPYSLHSNYAEIEMFIKWLKPSKITQIVKQSQNKSQKFKQKIPTFESYFYSLTYMKQRGLQYLRRVYCSTNQISKEKSIEQMKQNMCQNQLQIKNQNNKQKQVDESKNKLQQ